MASVRKARWTRGGVTKESWVVTYTDPRTGKRVQGGARTLKKDADKLRQKIEAEIERGEHTPVSQAMPIKAVCDAYLRGSELRMRSGAIGAGYHRNLRNAVDLHIVPHIGHRRFSDLTALEVEQWAQQVQATGNRRTSGRLSNTAIKSILQTLRIIEDYAIKHGHTAKRVVAEGRKELGRLQTASIRPFTADEVIRLVSAIEQGGRGYSPRRVATLRCYVQLAAVCGLRLGEINGLLASNVDLERGVIKVRHSLTQQGVLKGPKTKAGVRDVPMPDVVKVAIADWIRHHAIPNDRGLLFTSDQGLWMNRATWHTSWQRILSRAELTKPDAIGRRLRFHSLRHFAASRMVAEGIALPDVARLLGHEHFDMTLQVYAHPMQEFAQHQATLDRLAGDFDVPRHVPARLRRVTLDALAAA